MGYNALKMDAYTEIDAFDGWSVLWEGLRKGAD